MKEVLFNGHDIALMLVVGFSVLLAARVLTRFAVPSGARMFAAVFIGLNALWALDALLFWSQSIRLTAYSHSAGLPLSLSFVPFLQGPILYFWVKASLQPDKPISIRYLWHFSPAFITPFYLYWACFRFSPQQQENLILDLDILASADVYFLWFLTIKKLLPVTYGVICLLMLYRLSGASSQSQTAIRRVPLFYMVMPAIWFWGALTHILGQWLPLALSDFMGVLGNYLLLALISCYLFSRDGDLALFIERAPKAVGYSDNKSAFEHKWASEVNDDAETDEASQASGVSKATDGTAPQQPPVQYSKVTIQSHHDKAVRTVMNFMVNRYADSGISLKLASSVTGVSRGKLNAILKQETGLTFSGYLNQLRLTEAARLLKEDASLNISEIALSIGYNNVTYFNKLFKGQYGVTPNEYRSGRAEPLVADAQSC